MRLLLLLLLIGGISSSAYAYVDPGMAGFLYQLLYIAVAVVAGYFLGLKHFVKKIFRKKKNKTEEPEDITE